MRSCTLGCVTIASVIPVASRLSRSVTIDTFQSSASTARSREVSTAPGGTMKYATTVGRVTAISVVATVTALSPRVASFGRWHAPRTPGTAMTMSRPTPRTLSPR